MQELLNPIIDKLDHGSQLEINLILELAETIRKINEDLKHRINELKSFKEYYKEFEKELLNE